eukprot:5955109-Prymnesium_polylepis.1
MADGYRWWCDVRTALINSTEPSHTTSPLPPPSSPRAQATSTTELTKVHVWAHSPPLRPIAPSSPLDARTELTARRTAAVVTARAEPTARRAAAA